MVKTKIISQLYCSLDIYRICCVACMFPGSNIWKMCINVFNICAKIMKAIIDPLSVTWKSIHPNPSATAKINYDDAGKAQKGVG